MYHFCQLHYLPVEPYLSLYTRVENIWRHAMNLVYSPGLFDCNQILPDFHFLVVTVIEKQSPVCCLQNVTIVGNNK